MEDERRDEFLKSRGWEILHFKSKEIKENLASVLKTIRSKVESVKI
ncbi:MAG: DUF559 domain-containing protein [Candidatus Freyrarchaeum guaymaensis]